VPSAPKLTTPLLSEKISFQLPLVDFDRTFLPELAILNFIFLSSHFLIFIDDH